MKKHVNDALSSSLETIGRQEDFPLAKTLVEKGKTIFHTSYDHLKESEKRMISLSFYVATAEAISLDSSRERVEAFLIAALLGENKAKQLTEEIAKYADLIIEVIEENKLYDAIVPICFSLALELEEIYGKD